MMTWSARTRTAALTGIGVLLGGAAYYNLFRLGTLDPFRGIEAKVNPLGVGTGLQLLDADLKLYRKGRLSSKTHLNRVDVSQDRATFDLDGLTNGAYYGSKGPVTFTADHGTWNTTTQLLAVNGTVHASGKDFDLRGTSGVFDRRNDSLAISSPLRGMIYDGRFAAARLSYDMHSGDLKAHMVRWQGVPPVKDVAGGQETVTPRVWSLNGDNVWRHGGVDIAENGKATDGEILIFAPHVARDIKTDVLTATGRITYFSGKTDVVADKVVVYRKEKRAVFTGNVLMLVKPKKDQDKPPKEEEIPGVKEEPQNVKPNEAPRVMTEEDKKKDEDLRSGKTIREYPLNIKAEKITYWYQKGSRHAVIEGEPQPVAQQTFPDGRWRWGTAHDGYYDGEADTLLLNSAPGRRDSKLKNSIGDIWSASSLLFSTKDDQSDEDEDVKGKSVEGTFVDRSGEDTRTSKNKTSQPPPPGVTAAPPPSSTGSKGSG